MTFVECLNFLCISESTAFIGIEVVIKRWNPSVVLDKYSINNGQLMYQCSTITVSEFVLQKHPFPSL